MGVVVLVEMAASVVLVALAVKVVAEHLSGGVAFQGVTGETEATVVPVVVAAVAQVAQATLCLCMEPHLRKIGRRQAMFWFTAMAELVELVDLVAQRGIGCSRASVRLQRYESHPVNGRRRHFG